MAPKSTVTITALEEKEESHDETDKSVPKEYHSYFGTFKTELIWLNIISITILHLIGLYGFLTFPYLDKLKTLVFGFFMGGIAGFGVTAGAHRYWCHRSYKAKLPLQIILLICYSVAGQNTIFDWVRDHRVHHKFSETDADPHNSNRGFFFAHMGWLWMKKHPEVIKRGRQMDMSDITNDPLVKIHHKYFTLFKFIFCFLLPTMVPVYFWDETWYHSFLSQGVARYLLSLHFTWSVNSAAHLFGYKPYDVNINPRENLAVSFIAMGEGWHNYHHTFPWDYRASEHGRMNATLIYLNLFQKIGWAYDMKTPSKELVEMVVERRGPKSDCHDEIPESEEQKLKSH